MEISQQNLNRVNVWKNEITSIKKHDANFKWIRTHHKKIADFIKSKYTNLNSLRSHLSTLASVIKAIEGADSKIYKQYSQESIGIQKQIEDGNLDQRLSQSRVENYVTLREIEDQRDHIKELFYKDTSNVRLNQQYLLLSLYTYQPPIRQDYKNMLIVNIIPNKTENFILKKDNKYYVIIQNDKVIHAQGSATFELSQKLCSIIDDSLRYYPRKYILSLITDPNKPIEKQGYEKLLRDCFTNKRVTIDLIRSAYITDKYNNKSFTLRQKEELAQKMRNSVRIAQYAYHKIVNDEQDIDDNKQPNEEQIIDDFIRRLKIQRNNEQLKECIKHCISKATQEPKQEQEQNSDIRQYSKKYREKKKNVLAQKRKQQYEENKTDVLRNKILWNLNKGSKPRKATVKKYNLVYDGTKWN